MKSIEMDYLLVQHSTWRVVRHPRRASLLRKRGENIRWSKHYNAWIWMAYKIRPKSKIS